MNLPAVYKKLTQSVYVEGDSEDDVLGKSSMMVVGLPFAAAGIIWGVLYFIKGLFIPGIIPFSYGVISLLSFWYFLVSKKYKVYRTSQLVLMMLLPFLLQASLGGFIQSSAIILWSFVGPMGALVFFTAKKAVWWYIAFAVLVILSLLINDFVYAEFQWKLSADFINVVFVLNIIAVSSLVYFMLNHFVKLQAGLKKNVEIEKARSENLLLNILPTEIAEELKEKGEAEARDYTNVSVLFTDIKGFTKISENFGAKELVQELNYLFKAFDGICEKYGIEKIKTIGDAYMAASGIPVAYDESTKNAVMCGLEMARIVRDRGKEKTGTDDLSFEMRIGIHTGPVIAGIVGIKKFQYDIWGDTVNIASRMESSGEVGKVNISQATYELVKTYPNFRFTHRGKIEAKGKGEVDMYFVNLL